MKLYRRQLHSVDELRREKLRLQYEKLHTEGKDFFPVREHGRPDNNAKTNFLDFLGGLATSQGPLQMWLTLAKPILRAIGKKKAPKKVLINVAREVLFAYAKWKLLEMAYRGVKMYVRKQQKKKAEEHAIRQRKQAFTPPAHTGLSQP